MLIIFVFRCIIFIMIAVIKIIRHVQIIRALLLIILFRQHLFLYFYFKVLRLYKKFFHYNWLSFFLINHNVLNVFCCIKVFIDFIILNYFFIFLSRFPELFKFVIFYQFLSLHQIQVKWFDLYSFILFLFD